MQLFLITCIVKTPSSCEDSFFICSAKTCASSRMENSVSALQYPQERAEQIKARRHEKATETPRRGKRLSRKAARVLGVRASAVRLAMMAGGLQRWTKRCVWTELVEEEEKKLQGNLFSQLSSDEYECAFYSGESLKYSQQRKQLNHCASFTSPCKMREIHAEK